LPNPADDDVFMKIKMPPHHCAGTGDYNAGEWFVPDQKQQVQRAIDHFMKEGYRVLGAQHPFDGNSSETKRNFHFRGFIAFLTAHPESRCFHSFYSRAWVKVFTVIMHVPLPPLPNSPGRRTKTLMERTDAITT
jgi:hypothetical protein